MSKVKVSKKLDKQIAYVQNAIKQDKHWANRSIAEINELTSLIVDQYKDMNSFKIVRSGKGEDVMDQKDTKSIEDCKTIAVGIDGNKIWNKYTKE